MKILGIETSCDETAAAVVEDGIHVRSNVIASSLDMHRETGGVVPEVAAREHLRQISPVIDRALKDASASWDDIDAIAVTVAPGLIASLLIGVNTAQTLAYLRQKPLIPVHHIAGHIYANFLERKAPIVFPVLVLTVSGGHNELVLLRGHHDFQVIGQTLDDAAGEAFDKIARLLGLGFPGGPAIACAAEKGDPRLFRFPRARLEESNRFDFSFSGLKTAVRQATEKIGKLSEQNVADIAAGFEQAVVGALTDKLALAAGTFNVKEAHLAGGVSANRELRRLAREKLPSDLPLVFPERLIYCTDNAAMIAGAAYFMPKKPMDWKIATASASLKLAG